ncbi:peptidoglycan-binding protein [Actinomadura graeca]|uniref:Peptidoglycan-binding protein n=1 Tax=Actinomadura graeca TaxID=2750812 RepID=A0ABX8QXZ7_9ACTN|nr:peptidoglycan-binding domain-containing protein [Actinomadura graeca]QXJ21638.1 peptidoglycan-binding protein [Actinomadura graeca]
MTEASATEATTGHAPPYPGHPLKQPPPTKGEQVRTWQKQMVKRGFDLKVDGIYGPKSEDDARDLQKMAGLKIDGKVGEKTWKCTWECNITLPK